MEFSTSLMWHHLVEICGTCIKFSTKLSSSVFEASSPVSPFPVFIHKSQNICYYFNTCLLDMWFLKHIVMKVMLLCDVCFHFKASECSICILCIVIITSTLFPIHWPTTGSLLGWKIGGSVNHINDLPWCYCIEWDAKEGYAMWTEVLDPIHASLHEAISRGLESTHFNCLP